MIGGILMKTQITIAKYTILLTTGLIWGVISTFWLGWSILFAGNLMHEPGTYHYMENESFRPLGVGGIIVYILCFGVIFVFLKKKKNLTTFLPAMLSGILFTCAYFYFKPL